VLLLLSCAVVQLMVERVGKERRQELFSFAAAGVLEVSRQQQQAAAAAAAPTISIMCAHA
jgi:hypothetical protein